MLSDERETGPRLYEDRTVDNLQQIEQAIASIKDDYEKGKGGNKAAGTRVRKAMQDVKNLAQEIRKEMLENREATGS